MSQVAPFDSHIGYIRTDVRPEYQGMAYLQEWIFPKELCQMTNWKRVFYNVILNKLARYQTLIKSFQSSASFYIETSYFICSGNQLTGFYVKWNTGLESVKNTSLSG